MRILMVSKACVVGAYQTKLEELARLPGVELTVVVPPRWRDPSGTLPLDRLHVEGYDLLVEPVAFNGNYHLHFYPRIGKLLRRLRPELVHIDEEPYNLATAHVMRLARQVGACSLFFSWQNLLRRYPWPFRQMERYVLRHADCAIVGNRDSVQVWRAKRYAGPLHVIPQFGVDPSFYAPGASDGQGREGDGGLVIGYVGRLVEEKGVDVLLSALAGLAGRWRALVMGTGPERESLQALAQRLGVADRVQLVGSVPSAQMPDWYRQMDVLVLPSRTRSNWKEQFGRAVVEAMACGVAVVGSDSGEIPNVVGDGGLIVPEGDPEALREQLARLQASPDLRADLADRGRDRVLKHFTQRQVASQTYDVYRSLLRPGR